MIPGKNEDLIFTILDGYTDEPSTLGVPPYIAPIPRYIYGAIKNLNKRYSVGYLTIDEYRELKRGKYQDNYTLIKKLKLLNNTNILIVIAGAAVPGKYFSATPISLNEIIELGGTFDCVKFIGGAQIQCLKAFGFENKYRADSIKQIENHYDHVIDNDLDAGVHDYLVSGEPGDRYRTESECLHWSGLGSEVISQHPNFPNALMVEIEAGRGCVRYYTGGCSFCSEPKFGKPVFRPPEEIITEVKRLYRFGARCLRLGALSDLFSYWSAGIGDTETPRPNPVMVEKLLVGISRNSPELKVFHLDNANPAVMAANTTQTKKIIKLIIENCTSGNILSFGLESADPKVIEVNNLNSNPDEVFEMIKLVNHYGSIPGASGLPKLLPGLNFVYGLNGESKETFRYNYEFLKTILDSGLMVRRINLRQVIPTIVSSQLFSKRKKYHRDFVKHKREIRDKIDRPMLNRVCPTGTILSDVFTEKQIGNITFGRQLGTYPILVGNPYTLPLNEFHNIVLTDHGFRSVTGFSIPFKINHSSLTALQALPGIGKKRAVRILKGRPIKSVEHLRQILDDHELSRIIEQNLSYD